MPRVFGIGLPHTGGTVLQTLFDANGYTWRHHMGGRLASNIAYGRATKTPPLGRWPKATGFSGLYRMEKRHLPAIDAFTMFRFLHRHFPQAYFINTTRDPADWVAARFFADDGEHRALAAWHAKVHDHALPALWLEQQAKHNAACADYFADYPRFLDFNVTSEPVDILLNFLSKDFELKIPDILPDFAVDEQTVAQVLTMLEGAPTPQTTKPDTAFAMRVAHHCAPVAGPVGSPAALSPSTAHWATRTDITDRDGGKIPLAQLAPDGPYILDVGADKFERAQSALNEMSSHGAKPPLWVDMLDARFVGTQGRGAAPARTVAYNRRTGAANMTLWPLGGYHTLAPSGQPGGFPFDAIPFKDKSDICVWLGNMTGRMSAALSPQGRPLRSVYGIRDRAEKLAHDSPDWADVIADLDCVPRYRLVKTYRDHPDFTVGFVLRPNWLPLRTSPAFDGLNSPRQDRAWFHAFRYVLSLSGNDTGSNFLSAVATNSLVLKEEDGWDLFYTAEFKPWVHYVPLTEGALDVEEKLAWARANPEKCEQIARDARALFDKFADPANRQAYLTAIADRLNATR